MATIIKDSQGFCVKHNAAIDKSNFYLTSDTSLYSGIGYTPVCKRCIAKMMNEYMEKYNDIKIAMYLMCRKLDVSFSSSIFDGAVKTAKDDMAVFGNYMRLYNSIGIPNGVCNTFDEGEEMNLYTKDDEPEDIVVVEEEEAEIDVEIKPEIKLSHKEEAIKKEVIEMLEYDPFEGHSMSDQKFLYGDLYSYFGDEDVAEDRYLISQLVQIVNNNNTIRKMDYLISTLSGDAESLIQNESKIKSISATKKGIVENNDKIAKENGIAVNKRKDSNIKKSTLTATMEYLRGLNFEDAETDYYDQKKAYGMKVAADISFKAITDQLQFDENDIKEILDSQRELIREQEDKLLDVEEENRKLHAELELLKNENMI